MKLERNRAGNKYTFTPEDKKDEMLLDKIAKLEEKNKKLKEEDEELKAWLREKLPLALLKEYMEKFEGVDLKNV